MNFFFYNKCFSIFVILTLKKTTTTQNSASKLISLLQGPGPVPKGQSVSTGDTFCSSQPSSRMRGEGRRTTHFRGSDPELKASDGTGKTLHKTRANLPMEKLFPQPHHPKKGPTKPRLIILFHRFKGLGRAFTDTELTLKFKGL